MDLDLEALEAKLGWTFRDREILRRALTHRSRASEHNARGAEPGVGDNEQLEFLGDSILGFLVSEALVGHFPTSGEGRLSRLKAHLVSAAHLFRVSQDLGLGDYLLLGRGEEMSGGRGKKALLANALEAVIAALYLDAGPDRVRHFVLRSVVGDLDHLEAEEHAAAADHKSALQELAQALKLPAPRYKVVGTSGPEHSKIFVVEARVGGEWEARAEGASKKSASQRAAEQVLQQLLTANAERKSTDSAR